MKRKSFSPVHDTVSEPLIKPDLKKIKVNDQDEISHEMAPQYVKDSVSKKENVPNANIESTVDRFLNSLTKTDRNAYNNNSKAKAPDGDISPIRKNLNTTYGDMSEFSEKREPFQELTQLKLARKLAKLTKIDETNPVPDQDFNEKISKKLELMVMGALDNDPQKRFTSSKKSESLRKALQSVKSTKNLEGFLEVVEDDQNPVLNLKDDNHNELTPQTAAPGCISPDFFRVMTVQDILQDLTENKDEPENQVNQPEVVTTAFIIESPEKKKPEKPDNLEIEDEKSQSKVSSNANSSKDINKRRQSFSVRDANSKSKAFQAFNSSIKNTPPQSSGNPSIRVTPASATRRSSTVPKPTQPAPDRRKSVHVPNNGANDSGNKTKPSRKSCAPENLMNLAETLEENKQLKKEVKRKDKEIENLKREKQALVRKLKAVDPESVGENKEKNPLPERVSRVYCRVRPLENNNSGSVVNYPEIDGMKSPSRGVIPEVSALKCIELNNNQARKSDFYFDRVFSQTATQSEVFEEVLPVIQNAVQGNSSVSIVSLGFDDSGKEYTIQGNHSAGIDKDTGLIARAAETLLSKFQIGRTESSYLRLEFGCIKVVGEKVVDILCQADRKQDNNNDDNIMQLEENYTLPGIPVALSNAMWKQISGIQDLFKYLDLVSKTNANYSKGNELSFLVFTFKVIHGQGKHNFVQFVEVDVSNILEVQMNQSPMKSRNTGISDLFANLQKLSPETKEIALFYNINPSAENYMQSKELLDSSLKFTNSVKPLTSYL